MRGVNFQWRTIGFFLNPVIAPVVAYKMVPGDAICSYLRSMSKFHFSLILALVSCKDSPESTTIEQLDSIPVIAQEKEMGPLLTEDTILWIHGNREDSVEVIIRMPEGNPKGSILALPGWNYPNTGWCDSTHLCEEAMKRGYAIILPEMGKSIYCSKIYPETRSDWQRYPTRTWMTDHMIPTIQDLGLLQPGDPNFVMGLSTGARGAMLLGLDRPKIWQGIAVLSGDFDQSQFPSDNLYCGYYGPMDQFPERWEYHDNTAQMIEKLRAPVYIGHGAKDEVVELKHSEILADLLKSDNRTYVFNVNPEASHNYSYWNSEVDSVLTFFDQQQ